MLTEVELAIGTNRLPHLTFNPVTMTIFVGPNGSGKSLALRELQQYAETGPSTARHIVANIVPQIPDEETTLRMISSRTVREFENKRARSMVRLQKQIPSAGSAQMMDIDESSLMTVLNEARRLQREGSKAPQHQHVYDRFVSLFTVALDGKNRFALVDDRDCGDLQQSPKNHLAALFVDDASRFKVREVLKDAFGGYFVIDPTNPGTLRIRISTRPPTDTEEEQSLNLRARQFHGAAAPVLELSDGIKAFTGIMCALASMDFRVILIDEPEAFLHPPLARKLGSRMASLAAERKANVFASTHSPNFLMGAVDSGSPLNIVRLTYQQGRATARLLPPGQVTQLMRDPILRSTNVLNALFHVGAVVCEGDSDRCFYEEINTRLLSLSDKGIRDSVFLNAQNKQTIRRIVSPLRTMGIAAAAVVDFDIIKNRDLTHLLNDCCVPTALQHGLGVLRGDIVKRFEESSVPIEQGLPGLKGEDAKACMSLLEQLAAYGIFVVPNGTVESWLQWLKITSKKTHWLTEIFERMQSDPANEEYVKPGDGDVWEFLGRIAEWINNPSREGMPDA